MSFPPRKGDLPRDELLQRVRETLEHYVQQGINVDAFFKFTCEECGERCTFSEPNQLFESGNCHKCGHDTIVNFGGFALEIQVG